VQLRAEHPAGGFKAARINRAAIAFESGHNKKVAVKAGDIFYAPTATSNLINLIRLRRIKR